MINELSENLIQKLRTAQCVAVLCGAGISAESGVPTFRDAQSGLWARYAPEELATAQAFERNPALVWEWYEWRRSLISQAQPNPAHYALVEIEKHVPTFTLITQNVDGLHHQAGSKNILELHGNIWRNRCYRCNKPINIPKAPVKDLIRCPTCGGYVRPGVVWFGEPIPVEELQLSWKAARNCQIFFSIGTSALVYPAAAMPEVAQKAGALLVEINLQETPLSANADFFLSGRAGQILPELVETAWPG
jgi:NAD-dependent deacetylase